MLVGTPAEKRATLVNYLKKNPVNNMVYICPQTTDGAKMASLEYEVLEEKGGCSLVRVKLHTGRTHQIRVQMSGIGTPVYGDMRYGGETPKRAGWRCGRTRSLSPIRSPRSACALWRSRPWMFPRGSISTWKRPSNCDGSEKIFSHAEEKGKILLKEKKCV